MAKKSLFIQVEWYDPQELVKHLEHVYKYHRDRSKGDYIYNVVLDEIGSTSLSPNLKLIEPYLPGGTRRCFDNVFVGSHFMSWKGKGTAYREGMLNSAHRWRNLIAQRKLWALFRQTYPKVPFHFYINHEGVLDYFDNTSIRNAYGAYLLQSVRDAEVVWPGRAILWSPAIWSRKALSRKEESGIAHVVKRVKLLSGTRGITWLHIQDMQGRKRRTALRIVVQWYRELKALRLFDSLCINTELFRTMADGTIRADTVKNVRAREQYYAKRGVTIGASWELRWWFRAHVEE